MYIIFTENPKSILSYFNMYVYTVSHISVIKCMVSYSQKIEREFSVILICMIIQED